MTLACKPRVESVGAEIWRAYSSESGKKQKEIQKIQRHLLIFEILLDKVNFISCDGVTYDRGLEVDIV